MSIEGERQRLAQLAEVGRKVKDYLEGKRIVQHPNGVTEMWYEPQPPITVEAIRAAYALYGEEVDEVHKDPLNPSSYVVRLRPRQVEVNVKIVLTGVDDG